MESLNYYRVKVEDINMPFGAMVGLMIKVVIAAIPAGIILGILFAIVNFLMTLFGGAIR